MTPIRPMLLLAFMLGCESKPGVAVEGPEPAGATYAPPPTDDNSDPGPVPSEDTGIEDDGDSDGGEATDPCVPEDEICDGIDNDCDGYVDEGLVQTWYADTDGDGYGDGTSPIEACTAPDGFVDNAEDCDDNKDFIGPHVEEECNGADDDCDGRIDEGVGAVYYEDTDGDGYGDPDTEMIDCSPPIGHTTRTGDCNDDDPGIHPDADEVCNDLDDDCDGVVDDNPTSGTSMYFVDADGDGFGDEDRPITACEQPEGYADNATDCDDTADGIHPDALELCNGIDDDCDGSIDEEVLLTWYLDADGDGHGDGGGTTVIACTAPEGFTDSRDDCDDTRSDVYTDAPEACDGIDNDCDGDIDDGVLLTFFFDGDGDGWGSTATEACVVPADHVAIDGDCDDSRDTVHPTATELCDALDNDCDTEVDEDLDAWFYADEDGDGWGDPATATETCDPSLGWVTVGLDCDDTTDAAAPDVIEICDSIDNDCDGSVDEGVLSILYRDIDGDGYGDAEETTEACTESEDWVFDNTDCDDTEGSIHPDADEFCNDLDDDCDGTVDEDAVDKDAFYYDGDGDGYAPMSEPVYACDPPDEHILYVDEGWAFDCDDEDDAIFPGAEEICDGLDNDCNDFIDDAATDARTWYADDDGDGYGETSTAWLDCWGAVGWSDVGGDCNDSDDDINPGETDDCDAVDSNCNGVIDDDGGCPCAMGYREGHAYQFCTVRSNWASGRDECRDEDYELVTINNASEQSWVYSTARAFAWSDWWWIGYTDAAAEGSWVWADGSSSTYSYWHPTYGGDDWGWWEWPFTGEDCAHMYDGSGLWNDLPCDTTTWGSRNMYYICEASFD